jgi:hypothetical protein
LHAPIGVFAIARHDDALFMSEAWSITQGHWLGHYHNLTLAKGPGYPLFLALGYLLGFPLGLSQALLCLIAVASLSWTTWRLAAVKWLPASLCLLLVFDPAMLPLRVIRDSIYGMQVLLLLGLLWPALLVATQGRVRPGLAVASGLVFGWFWLTREEGVWLLPSLFILFAGTAWLGWHGQRRVGGVVRTALCFCGACVLVNLAFSTVNKLHYGNFVGVDFKEHQFKRALVALQSVQVGDVVPHVPVPEKVRSKIYEVSPAFAELRGNFENADSPVHGWQQFGCSVYPNTCGDYAGGWYMWALRDAVASHGYYRSPAAASAYYRRVANQVERACDDGRLQCRHSPIPFMPLISAAQWAEIPATLWHAVRVLVFAENRPPLDMQTSNESSDDSMKLSRADALLGRPLRTPAAWEAPAYRLIGWYYSRGTDWLDVHCAKDSGGGRAQLTRESSPDLVVAMHDPLASRQRFELELAGSCTWEWTDKQGAHALDIQALLHGAKALQQGRDTLYVDRIRLLASDTSDTSVMHGVHAVRAGLLVFYAVLLPILGGLGVLSALALLLMIALRKTPLRFATVLSVSLWAAVVMRLLVVTLVDVSAFPAINALYMTPAYPLMVVAALFSAYALLDGWEVASQRRLKKPNATH